MTISGPLIDPLITADWTRDALLFVVLGGICLGVGLASIAYLILQRRPSSAAARNGVGRLDGYIWTWSGLLALLLLASVLGRTAIIAAFAAVSFGALREFFSLIHTRRADHWALLAAFFVVLPAQYVLVAVDWYGLFTVLLPVYAFLLMPVIPGLRGDTTRFMDRVAEVQWGLMISVYCLSHVPALLSLDIAGYGGRQLLLVIFLILVATLSDQVRAEVAARRPPQRLPRPSGPEIAAAVGMGLVAGCSLCPLTPFPLAVAGSFGAVIAMMGLAGRLVLGAIKQDRGVADWTQRCHHDGTTSENEEAGGLLDRLDALIFAAPVFFHLTRFVFTP
jgi:phosphatidate cytidylyltransferase